MSYSEQLKEMALTYFNETERLRGQVAQLERELMRAHDEIDRLTGYLRESKEIL